MFLVRKLFKKPQNSPKYPNYLQLHKKIIQLSQQFRSKGKTKFYRQLKQALLDENKNKVIINKMGVLIAYLNKDVNMQTQVNSKYMRKIFEYQIRSGLYNLIIDSWVLCMSQYFILQLKLLRNSKQKSLQIGIQIEMTNPQKMSTVLNRQGAYNLLKRQIYNLGAFFWSIGKVIFHQFLTNGKYNTIEMDVDMREYLIHLIVNKKKFGRIYDSFIHLHAYSQEIIISQQDQMTYREKVIQHFQSQLKQKVQLSTAYDQIFQKTVSRLKNLQKQHRIQQKISIIVQLPKLLQSQVASCQQKQLKNIKHYQDQPCTDVFLSYLLLLHHDSIQFDLKYLDLVVFANNEEITESKQSNFINNQQFFKGYCQVYTSSLPNRDLCFSGISFLENSVDKMKKKRQEIINQVMMGQ